MADGTLVTLTRHLIEEQTKHPDSRGEFSNMFLDLTLALKIISREVMKAGLVNILGETSDTNIQGETVMKLDRYADDRIFKAMDHGGHLCCMASEECENLIKIPTRFDRGDYVLGSRYAKRVSSLLRKDEAARERRDRAPALLARSVRGREAAGVVHHQPAVVGDVPAFVDV